MRRSMSNVPYYLEKARAGFGYGHQQVTDAIIKDGLWDTKYQIHMVCYFVSRRKY
jgi:acetyl-CoA C-acetyltransferase